MVKDIFGWLDELGFSEYADAFADNHVDFEVLIMLTSDDLKEIGVVSVGHRRKLLDAAAQMGRTDECQTDIAGPPRDWRKLGTDEAARRQVTALFADITGFTRLSSTMDAEETHAMLNGFFAAVDEVVKGYGGTIDKHIGDAVMAVFGAPVAHTDDPERALRAARDIHDAVAALSPPLQVHIGVASGQVVASTTGSAAHTEYTVTGDSVNLAARLTELAKAGDTLVSASVRRALGARFEGELLGERMITGLLEPVAIWRLDAITEARSDRRHPFVGRLEERARFDAALTDCLEKGVGETLVVRGEAGIGKTRLLEEFERVALERGFAVHTGLVLDFGTAKGQDAIHALVRSLLTIAPNSGKKLRTGAADKAIAEGLLREERRAFLNDLLDLEQTSALGGLYDAMDNESRNRGKRETMAELVRSLARAKPLLLKIEDLHWADALVLEHSAYLAREAVQSPILILLTTRLASDPFDDAWRSKCEDAAVATIDLGPMAAANACELANSFKDIPSEVLHSCVERAGGNPLFLEQLLYNAEESDGSDLPGSVQGIVQARLDALHANDRKALQAGSVLGQRFSGSAVAALTPNVDFRPEVLLKQALIRPAGNDYHFAHALIRDGVYASLLKPQRTALHRRAAEFFHDGDPVLYAEHLDQAEDPGAVRAYLTAATQQHNSFRFDAALRFLERALELDSPSDLRFELMCFQGDLLRDLGRTAESITVYEGVLAAAGSGEELCRANLGLAAGMRVGGRGEDGLAYLDHAEDIATQNGMSAILAETHFLRGNFYFPLGRFAECEAEHEISLRHARDAGSREAEAQALGGLADASYAAGHMRTANRNFSDCVELAAKHGLRRIEVANKPMLAHTEMYLNRFAQAEGIALSAIDDALATGNSRAELIAQNLLIEISYSRGDFEKGKVHGERSLELARRIGATSFEPFGDLARGKYELLRNGDREAAFAALLTAYETAQANTETFMGPWLLSVAAVAAPTDEQREWALREGERILASGAVSHNYFIFYANAMEACRAAGEWDDVLRYADALAQYTKEEPLEWSDFHIKLGRTLAAIGRGECDQAAVVALNELHDTAKKFELMFALPTIEAALTDAT